MAEIETVRLVRDPEQHPDSHEAIVEIHDVPAFVAAGWVEAAAPEAPASTDAAAKPAKGRGAKAAAPEAPVSDPASIDSPEQAETAGEPPLTRREIEADLSGLGIEFHPAAPLPELRAMRDAAEAAAKAAA